MSISRALNSSNDIFVKDGRITIVESAAEVIQHVRSRLQFYLGEWFLNLNSGTPWFQDVFIKPANLNNIESIIKSRISNTPDLSRITSFSMEVENPNTRFLKVSFSAETTFGEINSGELYINV